MYYKHLGISLKNLRIPLQSWGFHFRFLMSSISGGSSKVSGEFSFVLLTFSGGISMLFSGLSSMSNLDIYLGTQLLRVLLRLTVSNVIGGGSEVVRKSFQSFPRNLAWIFSSAWSTDHVGGIWYFLWVDILLHSRLAGFFGILLVPCYRWGLQISWKECFAIVSGVPESLLPALYSRCTLTKKVSTGLLPSIWRDFEFIPLSSFYVRRRGQKYS